MLVDMQEKLMDLISSVATRETKEPRQIVLAYSGGVDSEVLAHGLSTFAQQHPDHDYLLVHVHHGLSENADTWVQHCVERAHLYGLECHVQQVELVLGPRISVEAAAREARYNAISALMRPEAILLTAHHQDDQLETVLLALKRGLGPKGLSAMGEVQKFKQDCWLVRPLLNTSKDDIQTYAQAYNLSHITDESNLDISFDRNFLRQEIIPQLKARWGAIATTASRSAALCAEQQAVLELEVCQRLPRIIAESNFSSLPVVNLIELEEYPKSWQALLLRGYMERYALPIPSKAQLDEMLYQLFTAKQDAQLSLQFGKLVVRRHQKQAFFSHLDERQEPKALEHQLLANLMDSSNDSLQGLAPRLRLPKSEEQVSVVFGLPGATRCAPHNRNKGREFKKLLQENGVPPWVRPKLAAILYDGRLACIPGLWIEKQFLAPPGGQGIELEKLNAVIGRL